MKKLAPASKIYISKSKIPKAGRGVFAASPIKKGELIERCPVLVVKGGDVPRLKPTILKSYYFIWHKPKKIATKVGICLGFGSIYNHSYEPNATYKKNLKEETIDFVAIRPIQRGEEITVNYNYGKPNDKSALWIKEIRPAN